MISPSDAITRTIQALAAIESYVRKHTTYIGYGWEFNFESAITESDGTVLVVYEGIHPNRSTRPYTFLIEMGGDNTTSMLLYSNGNNGYKNLNIVADLVDGQLVNISKLGEK